MTTVTLKNVGTETFVDKWAGVEYRIKPGVETVVPVHIAKHWMGDWDLKGVARSRDLQRVKVRRGSLPTLQLVEDDDEKAVDTSAPTGEEAEYLKSIRKGAFYEFPDGERIQKKDEALAYLRAQG